MNRRVDIKKIIANTALRRKLSIQSIIFIQATSGITTTWEQAERAYDKVQQSLKQTKKDS